MESIHNGLFSLAHVRRAVSARQTAYPRLITPDGGNTLLRGEILVVGSSCHRGDATFCFFMTTWPLKHFQTRKHAEYIVKVNILCKMCSKYRENHRSMWWYTVGVLLTLNSYIHSSTSSTTSECPCWCPMGIYTTPLCGHNLLREMRRAS